MRDEEQIEILFSVRSLISDLTQLNPDQAIPLTVLPATDVVRDAVERTRKLYPQQEFFINVDSQEKIACDYRSLIRVMQNIFVNALQAAGGDCVIHISDSRSTEASYCVEIHNTGSFIDAKNREKIFNLGFTTGKVNGSGLGLAYAAQIMQQCGGSILCESDLSVGTSFILVFPRVTPEKELPSAIRLAVVDDDLFVGLSWQRQCEGTNVDHYRSPEEFIATLETKVSPNSRYQVVILDFHFEDSAYNGIDIARALKSRDAGVFTILSIFQQMTINELGGEGCVDLVIGKKALSFDELSALIRLTPRTRLRA